MRITLPLHLFKLPNGHIFRGKNRIVKDVTPKDVNNLRNEFKLEQENMFYLRHTYLTPEQSFGHMNELKAKGVVEPFHLRFKRQRHEEFSKLKNGKGKHRTLEDQLGLMKATEGWEFTAGSN